MNNVKIQYALKNGITYNINDDFVKTGDKGFTFDGMHVCAAKGKKNTYHFRAMPGAIISPNRIFHVNCQNYIKETKRLELDDFIIEAHKVLLEHDAQKFILDKIPFYSMRPDCLFLDKNNEIICIVEVNVTHAKSEDDIIKINQYKIPTYELKFFKHENNYKNPISIECLFKKTTERENEKLINEIKVFEIRIKTLINEINSSEITIKRLKYMQRFKVAKTFKEIINNTRWTLYNIFWLKNAIQKKKYIDSNNFK